MNFTELKAHLKPSGSFKFGLLLNLWLILMVLGTALLLVRWQYTSRSLFVQIEKSENVGKQLASNNASAMAERRSLASPARVESLATRNLGMKTADPSVTMYLAKP
jgi:cell division protein FtsL